MKNKNDNKSLFLYTSLIFIVAILLIILAFFGQANVQKNQPELNTTEIEVTEQPSSNGGIAEKASVLSEENRVLLEENTRLEEELRLKNAAISGMENENFNLNERIRMNDLLLQANGYLYVGNYAKSAEALEQVDYDSLSSDQQIIYNNVKSKLN